MATVNVIDGIKYGFGLMWYVLGVGIVAGIVMLVGIMLAQGGGVMTFVGGLIALVGFLAMYAGMMGIAYKVVADGVTAGVDAAGSGSAITPEPQTETPEDS